MSPVDQAVLVSKISPYLSFKYFVNFRCVHMRERAGFVSEISLGKTKILVSELEILPYEHFSPVTGMNAE